MLYTTLVHPVMEYATTVWAPHTAPNCNKLEQVQQSAARFTCCKYERTASATSMLNELKWESNSQRLTMFYRMPVQPSRSKRSGHDQMYQVPYARIDVFKHSFFPATVRMWNSLPVGSNCYPVSLNSVIQSRHQCSSPSLTHVTIDVHLSASYSITRGMHFTGR